MTAVDRAWFSRTAKEYEAQAAGGDFPIDYSQLHPCDDRQGGAIFDAHYARCDLWAAQRIEVARWREYQEYTADVRHVDVGSRLDGFVTHLLASRIDVMHVDVRAPGFEWPGFAFRQDDARALATFADASIDSLSCLHAAEHVGLGRYGDELDADGMRKTMASLARVLAPGGRLYFAVPIGRQRVCFNAHRIASPSWVASTFAALGLTLDEFAAVDDAGAWHPDARMADYESASYSCGCFMLRRPS